MTQREVRTEIRYLKPPITGPFATLRNWERAREEIDALNTVFDIAYWMSGMGSRNWMILNFLRIRQEPGTEIVTVLFMPLTS